MQGSRKMSPINKKEINQSINQPIETDPAVTGRRKLPDKDVKHTKCAQTFEGKYNVTRIRREGIQKNQMKLK